MAAAQKDAQLVKRVRGGSLDALGDLYERHADAMFRAAYRVLGTQAEAEDVVQDLFVGLPGSLAKYDERGSFQAWLRAVAVRSALMTLRRRARDVPWDDAGAPDTVVDPTSRIAVERALTALPEPLRVVFILREVEGYPHREIGALLGISATASAIRLHRAWKQLRKGLGIR